MKRLKVVLAIVVVIILCEVAFLATLFVMNNPTRRLKEQLELAQNYLSELEYEEAIAAYRAAIEIDPKCEEAYMGLVDVYVELDDLDAAMDVLEEAKEIIHTEEIEERLAEITLEIEKKELEQEQEEIPQSTQEEVVEEMVETVDPVFLQIYSGKQYSLLGDESAHTIEILEYEGSEYGDNKVVLRTDVSESTLAIAWIYVKTAYLMSDEENRCFLLLTVDLCSDDYKTYVYQIKDGELNMTDEVGDLVINSPLSHMPMSLAMQLQVLGSYYGYAKYTLNENGKLCQEDEIFTISVDESNAMELLTVKKELPVTIDGNKEYLSIGTQIRIIGTDNKGKALFRVEGSGEEGEITYEKGDGVSTWGCLIEGTQDFDYFEFLPYAG